jgi:hypothetical protein
MRHRKKWQLLDYILLIIQVLFPLITLLIAWLAPTANATNPKGLSEDAKLAIIGLGILVPIIVQSVDMIKGQKETETSFSTLKENVQALEEKINHINPMLERAFFSGNDRVVRFALRRVDEVNALLKHVVDNLRSGKLKPREYYEELDYLAQLIRDDKRLHGSEFKGEIWAMTSFADHEWTDPDGYEGRWTDTLQELVALGIQTKRLCIVSSSLLDAISADTFTVPTEISQFPGFMQLVISYYGVGSKPDIAQHYIIRDTVDEELTRTAGFFAIKLTNGELHILTGETVDPLGSMSAEVLFKEDDIKHLRELCLRFMADRYTLEKIIKEKAKPSGFLQHLSDNGVTLSNN